MATLIVAMAGCAMESIYTFDLHIENRLPSPIFYCGHYELPECNNKIENGKTERLPYISHVRSDAGHQESFDDVQIKFCGKMKEIKEIRLISPVIKGDRNQYKIIIDEQVCHEANPKEN